MPAERGVHWAPSHSRPLLRAVRPGARSRAAPVELPIVNMTRRWREASAVLSQQSILATNVEEITRQGH